VAPQNPSQGPRLSRSCVLNCC